MNTWVTGIGGNSALWVRNLTTITHCHVNQPFELIGRQLARDIETSKSLVDRKLAAFTRLTLFHSERIDSWARMDRKPSFDGKSVVSVFKMCSSKGDTYPFLIHLVRLTARSLHSPDKKTVTGSGKET